MSFAHTKIQQPRPRAGLLLPRPALEHDLASALGEQRAVLLCAPAGYGKTALLTRALQQVPERHAVAWISLDAGDDLQRLLECLMAALEPFDPPWRIAPEGLIAAAQRAGDQPATAVVDELVNTLEACDVAHGVIVLDDVHHLDDPACLGFVALLLQRLGARWTIALTARHEPALRLARLRALGELTDIGQTQLQFTRDEVSALLAGAGHDADLAEALHQRTGGWAAGLRLALNGARGGSVGSAIDRPAFDFLATEVLARIHPPLREFLLRVSVLHDLDASRCAAVSGDADAARRLDEIERLGLFASVIDDAVPTLRLHELFRDALQHRLHVERPDEWTPLLLRAAAVETDPVRRQGLLLAAQQPEQAAQALLVAGKGLITQGAVNTLVGLCEQFPAAFADTSAELQRVAGMAKWTVWDCRAAERHLARAQALYAARGDTAAAQSAMGHRAITLIALGRLPEARALIDALPEQPQDPETLIVTRLARTWHALEGCHFHEVAQHFGALVQVLESHPTIEQWFFTVPPPRQTSCRGIAGALSRWASAALSVAADRPVPLRSNGLLAQGWLALWQGRLDAAQEQLRRAEADAQWTGQQIITRNHGLAMRAMVHALRGEHAAAVQAMRTRLAEHPSSYGDWGVWHSLFFAARVAAACGDLPTARDWAQRLVALHPGLPDANPERLRPVEGLQGTLAWLEDRHDDALALWRSALAHEENADLLGQGNEIRMRLAHALASSKSLDEAAALLEPALARAADGPGGALLAGAPLIALAAVEWQGRLSREQIATLQRWAASLPAAEATMATPATQAVAHTDGDELSAREREVLALIANGDSNKVIARSLDLSPYTVKRHVANILDKLAVASRGQAAAWYRAQAL